MGNTSPRPRDSSNSSNNMDSDDDIYYGEEEEFLVQDNDYDEDEPNDLSENSLVLILRQLIESGEIHILNSEEQYYNRSLLPVIKKQPNLDLLKKSDVYQNTKQASGFGTKFNEATPKWSVMNMISNRQNGFGHKHGSFTQFEKCKMNNMFIPNKRLECLMHLDAKVFCGSFSRDGKYFMTASQDQKIRLYNASTPAYKMKSEICAKDVSWCILDIDFSPNGEFFAYSTWSDCLHISPIDGTTKEDIQCLLLHPNGHRFGLFSLAFSNCGKQILSGASDGCLYAYDLIEKKRIFQVSVAALNADVNAVGFIDDTSNIFFSGCDDGFIKIWDRRCLNETVPEPVGLLAGHFDGITYIDSRNDGRYIISNSKDQSIKLWDIRQFSPKEVEKNAKDMIKNRNWDYRWDTVPKKYYNITKPMVGDTSVMTYRGHKIQKSLIRAKFSPAFTTGQRYIYTGCGTGRLIIYDVLTGKIVQAIEGHNDIVRDVAWHPYRTEILTSSWDYTINLNAYKNPEIEKERKVSSDSEDTDDNCSFEDDRRKRGGGPLRRSQRIAQQRYRTSD